MKLVCLYHDSIAYLGEKIAVNYTSTGDGS
jgi:hypothetical protein